MLDVINELRAAGAEVIEIRGGATVRVGLTPGWSAPRVRWSTAKPSTRRIRFWRLVIRRRWPRR